MIIPEIKSTLVETNTGAVATRFKIKASSRAFQILSGFYSDKLAAIPRELGANAWDAHVVAGTTDKQFEVHVPNVLEPWFSIRDFGTGLSPVSINTIYTTYFESTKTQSNDEDGCMGLGSKTPFNYAENFMVTSWFNGIKSVYNCFIDDGGGPSILPLGSELSNEHNGLQVKFAVKQEDISTFTHKIRQAYLPFRVKPKLVGTHDIQFPEVKHSFKGDGWAMRASNEDSYHGNSCALMGNYSYPIDNSVYGWNSCKGVSEEELTAARQILQNGRFDFQFNIGDLDVAPNKEQLQYDSDDRTRSAIIRKASLAKKELREHVLATIKPTSMWDAMKLYWTYNSHNSPVGYEIRRVLGDIEIPYNGKNVTSCQLYLRDVFLALNGGKDRPDGALPYSINTVNYSVHKNRMKMREHNNYQVLGVIPVIVFYTDQDSLKKSRVRKYLTEKFPTSTSFDFLLVTDKSPNFSTMWEHQKYLGIPIDSFINVESLPKPAVVRNSVGRTKSVVVNGVYSTGVAGLSYEHPHVDFRTATFTPESTSTYYYVPMYYTKSYFGEVTNGLSSNDAAALLSKARSFGIIPDDVKLIYGINKKTESVLKVGTWVNVFDALKKKVNAEEIARLEQLLFERDLSTSMTANIGKLDNLDNLLRSNRVKFIGNLKNPMTIKFFKFIYDTSVANTFQTTKVRLSPVDSVIVRLFSVKSVSHVETEFCLQGVIDTLSTKYLGIFSILDSYSSSPEKVAAIINFFDENAKSS